MKSETILLSHGSGGRMMDELIREVFIQRFGNTARNGIADSAVLEFGAGRLAFTTDSFVVDPLFFPGGDIGKLAVCGTVNDLAVAGAKPTYLSCSFILEEGLPIEVLRKIVESMADEAKKAGVSIVTGDTKVVNHGKADKIFINTSGIGSVTESNAHLASGSEIRSGDAILVNGSLGDHGIAVMTAREGVGLSNPVISDCTSLYSLIDAVLASGVRVKFMRDATRGGLASVLCEIAEFSKLGIGIEEQKLVVFEGVRGASEIFGFDPLYIANEGKVVMIVDPEDAASAIQIMHNHADGKDAAIIGNVVDQHPGKVTLLTTIGGRRIIDKLAGEQLPRIC